VVGHEVEARADVFTEGREEFGAGAFGGAMAGIGVVAELPIAGEATGNFRVLSAADGGIDGNAVSL
jgi:hypothetical protein